MNYFPEAYVWEWTATAPSDGMSEPKKLWSRRRATIDDHRARWEYMEGFRHRQALRDAELPDRELRREG